MVPNLNKNFNYAFEIKNILALKKKNINNQ